MAEKIFVLENSKTVQKEMVLNCAEHALVFFEDAFSLLDEIKKTDQEGLFVLVNVELKNPSALELSRLIKSFSSKNKVGLYSVRPIEYTNFLEKNSFSDFYFLYNSKIFAEEVKKFFLESSEKNMLSLELDFYKNAIINSFYGFLQNWENIDDLVKNFLGLVLQYIKVPCASLFEKEDDGTFSYLMHANNMQTSEIQDFIAVCKNDYQKCGLEKKGIYFETKVFLANEVFSKESADGNEVYAENPFFNFSQSYVPGLKLENYDTVNIVNEKGKIFATLHIISQNDFSLEQTELLRFCAKNIAYLLERAIIIKQKMFFEKRIRKAFGRFVPEQIIDEIVQQTDAEDKITVGENRKVAVLFSDIRSFTNISERNKPEVIVSFLNTYFTIMVEIIKKHGGTIDKFIGDAIMALFGAPVSYEDNCRRAVLAANEMRKVLPTIPLGNLVMPEGLTFDIGIGINYGDLIVGSIGSKDKADYSVIGDSVNLASRLEGLTKTYGAKILVSNSVVENIEQKEDLIFRYLDDVKVKGKEFAVPIYSVDYGIEEFSEQYRIAYSKGLELYKQGIFNLAKEYFQKALQESSTDKASILMLDRCEEFIKNPPENWDGSIAFKTK